MKQRFSFLIVLLLLVSITVGCGTQALRFSQIPVSDAASQSGLTTDSGLEHSLATSASASAAESSAPETSPGGNALAGQNEEMTVHFLDVGQADCILICQSGHAMLIDAGNNADADIVVSYLNNLGVDSLDYVIGTHPHEDHIGGLDAVISSFAVGRIILPGASSTTRTFEDLLLAIKAKGLKVTRAVPGSEYALGSAAVSILGPVLTAFEDLNDSSVVCKVSFGETSFLFTGDAEAASENAMLQKGYDLSADLLKVGHHGSASSTGDEFLRSVAPKFAVISAGAGNDYGHPAAATLERLQTADISVFRTDLAGTVVATSNGVIITFNVEPQYGEPGQAETAAATVRPTAQPSETTAGATTKPGGGDIVYITETGHKFHRTGCSYLKSSKIPIPRAEALTQGYEPCSICDP